MSTGHLTGSHMDFETGDHTPERTNGAASKNGHAIPTVNGLAFEDGARVAMTGFDHEHADREFIEQQRDIGRKEALMEPLRMVLEVLDRVIADQNPALAAECHKYVFGLSERTEVEIGETYGVSKQAVSKRIRQLKLLIGNLGLPPSAPMRTEKACKSFKEATLKSWKKRPKQVHQNGQPPIAV